MIIVRVGDILKIGKDLVDATTGTLKAHGQVTVQRANISTRYLAPKTLTWVSTADCVQSERVIRRAVTAEGQTVTLFQSQAV